VTTGTFVEWVQLLPNIENLIRKGQADSSIIETLDSVRFKFLASLLLMNKKSVLITGSSGIGKTVIIKSMLKSLTSTGFTYKVNSILGDIFNYSERKNQTSQDTVNSLFNNEETESKKLKTDEFGKNFTFLGCFLNKFTFSL
jgi:Cdc6-like AAA superfamily ATPase